MRLDTMQASVPCPAGQAQAGLDLSPVQAATVPLDGSPEPCGRRPTLAPWQARRVARQLAERICEPIRVGDLSAPTRLTTGYFSKAFRGAFGMSPHAYLIELRITRACELMLHTDQPLAQIALACGLCDQAHLTRLFRRRHGQTPAAWRRGQLSAPAGARHPRPQERKP